MALTPLLSATNTRARAAIFLSGTGTNAEKILEHHARSEKRNYDVVTLVTDRPRTSRASEIGEHFRLPVIACDIGDFYRQHGVRRVSIATEDGRRLRTLWTEQLRHQIAPLKIDFGLFAGFIPLTNLTANLVCLNVHPGDLTVMRDGARYLVGLHTIPAERAILAGLNYLRSSVILAEPYTASGDDMDSGPILGMSDEVRIDRLGYSLEELRDIAEQRPPIRPVGGFQDALETVAADNLERLKQEGDWNVFPRVVDDFAAGRFACDENGVLHYRDDGWQPVKTVIYTHSAGVCRVPPSDGVTLDSLSRG